VAYMGCRTRVSVSVLAFAVAIAVRPALLLALDGSSRVIVCHLHSESLSHSAIGTNPVRELAVYLPPEYDGSAAQRYPVIYFLPNPFEQSYRYDFDHRDAQGLFDRAIADGVIRKFILVAVDMNSALGTSW
jgi:hypothetical protein